MVTKNQDMVDIVSVIVSKFDYLLQEGVVFETQELIDIKKQLKTLDAIINDLEMI